MSAQLVANTTLGGALPQAVSVQAALDVALATAIPELQAKVTGAGNVQLAVSVAPPDLTGTIAAAGAVVVSLQAAINGPTVTLQADALLTLIAEINALIGALEAYASLSASIAATLGTAGVSVITFTGNPATAGSELQGAIDAAGLGGSAGGILLIASAAAPRIAIGTFCGVEIST